MDKSRCPKDIIALVSKSQQSSAANGCSPRVVISSEALRLKSHEGTVSLLCDWWRHDDLVHIGWILHTMAFLKQVYIVQCCSEALRGRWLYSPSEALSALGRAWKVIHNEGAWGGGSLAIVGSIHWDESNTSPLSNSCFLLSTFFKDVQLILKTEWSMKKHSGSVSEPHTTAPTINTNACSNEPTFIIHQKQQCYEKDQGPEKNLWKISSKLLFSYFLT